MFNRIRLAVVARATRGYTLVEVMIVVTLIIVLTSVGLATYSNSVRRSREAVLKEDLFRMRDAIDQYYADKNKYPSTLQDLVTDGYLREIPKDPITNSADSWVTENAEPDPSNLSVEPGIFNVKSGSEEMSMDGTPYAEWD
jgi:general secretion pathway protein G